MSDFRLKYDYTQGTLKDFSGNSLDGSFQGSPFFTRSGDGKNNFNVLDLNGNNNYVQATAPAVNTDYSYEAYFKLRSNPSGFTLVMGDVNSAIFIDTSGRLVAQASDGTGPTNVTDTLGLVDQGFIHVVMTVDVDGRIKLYRDGIFIGQNSRNLSGPLALTNFYIGHYTIGALEIDAQIAFCKMHNKVLSSAEVAEEHTKAKNNTMTVYKDKYLLYTPPSVRSVATGSAWNMKLENGQVVDKGADGNTFSLNGAVGHGRSPWGETTCAFNGDDGYLDAGAGTNLDFTTESFGGWAWVKANSFTNGAVFSRGRVSIEGYSFYYGAGVIVFQTQNPSGNQQAISASLTAGVWYLLGFFSEAGGNNEVYVDNVQSGTTTARVDPVTNSRNFTMGKHSFTSSNYVDGEICAPFISQFSTKAEFQAKMQEEFDRVSNKVLYHEDFSDAFIHQGTFSDGNPLPGTLLTSSNQTCFISDGEFIGDKACYGSTFGSQASVKHDGWPYGTWEIRFNHTTNINSQFGFVAPGDVVAFGTTSYFDTHGSNNRIRGIGTPGINFQSAAQSVSSGLHTIKIQKTKASTNNVTIYLDDMNTPLAADTGSNPYTDTTTDAQFMVYANYGSPSTGYIASVKHYYGIV